MPKGGNSGFKLNMKNSESGFWARTLVNLKKDKSAKPSGELEVEVQLEVSTEFTCRRSFRDG